MIIYLKADHRDDFCTSCHRMMAKDEPFKQETISGAKGAHIVKTCIECMTDTDKKQMVIYKPVSKTSKVDNDVNQVRFNI